jgi:hypothetical protein
VLLLVALVAAFLPIGSSLGISHILRLALNAMLYVIGLIYAFIGFFFASLIDMTGIDMAEATPAPTPEPLPTMAPPVVADTTPGNPLLAMLVSSAFWVLIIATIIAALLFFLRERGVRLEWDRVRGAWQPLSEQLRALWRRLRRRTRAAGRALRERLRPDAPDAGTRLDPAARGLPRLRPGSPREQIRYYYLAAVRRARERGVPRAANETPLEYADDLKAQWPEAETELDELTDAFLAARYSPQPLDKPDEARAKAVWERVRERLRGNRERGERGVGAESAEEDK